MSLTIQKVEPLDIKLFQNPTVEYRGIPFWAWNCKVTKDLIDWQLDFFEKMGFGGVNIHTRVGLDNEYLGEKFFQLVKYTVEQCKEKGLICWLYDDDRFPSGAAGGKVTRNINYRARDLLLTEKYETNNTKKKYLLNGFSEDKASFEKAIASGEKPKGYYLGAYHLVFEDNILKNYSNI
ncbi:hypothetical protein [Enterococcus timonensis]|uniref:hypothetical protein n=1 Tax=Enterococcus timonensis TaxID=1852364 RepID=UPI0009F65EDA|nr:hypothetical protein [Enterococcus timonensis]